MDENSVILILKGAPTFIFSPQEKIKVSPWGEPGMATAGSGDVLAGIVAAFLAQGLSSLEAATLAVYIHSTAGQLAAQKLSNYSLIASDIIDFLPTAFKGSLL